MPFLRYRMKATSFPGSTGGWNESPTNIVKHSRSTAKSLMIRTHPVPMNKLKHLFKHLVAPNFAVRLHAVMLILWLIPGTIVTVLWLANSVAFVAWLSLYALVIGHWSSLQAALAERRVKDQNGDDS